MSAPSPDSTPVPPPPHVDLRRGTLWMLFSMVCFTGNSLMIKHFASDRHIDPWLTMSFRFGVGLLMTVAIFYRSGALSVKRSFLSWLLASRGVLGALGTAAYYHSIGPLGVGKATLIGNTWCVWAAIMASTMLHEKLGLTKFFGIVLALAGLGLLTNVSAQNLLVTGHWEMISLGGAVLAALVVVVIRQLTRTETSATIFASQCLYGLLLAVPFAFHHITHLTTSDVMMLGIAGLCAAFGQLAMTEGFRFLTVAVGGAYQITLPLVISIGGILLFGEHFSPVQMFGAVLILAGSFQTVVGIHWRRLLPKARSSQA